MCTLLNGTNCIQQGLPKFFFNTPLFMKNKDVVPPSYNFNRAK